MKKPGEKRYILLDLFVALLMLMLCANMTIIRNSDPYVSSDISKIPQTNVGLLLGTSKLLKNGQNNDFFFNRIEAAVELYKKGKIKYILVSGDNGSKFYNEPRDMRDELIRRGVPANVIYLDYAGFRTLDSVVRAHKIFGQDSFTVISQKFHNERAVFIARKFDIEAYGYNAKDVVAYRGFKTKLREFFARTKVFLDFIMGVDPKFLGEKVKIG